MRTFLCIVAIIAAVAVEMTAHASASTSRHYAVVPEPATRLQRQNVLNGAAVAGYRLVTVADGEYVLVRP